MRTLSFVVLLLVLAFPAWAQEHPCTTNPQLEPCVALAQQLANEAGSAAGKSLKEALIASAPVITERLDQALAKMGEWVEATEAFATEQTPILVREILVWAVADQAFWVILGALMMVYCWRGLAWTYRNSVRLKRLAEIREEDLLDAWRNAGCPGGISPDEWANRLWRFVVPISATVVGFLGFLFFVANIMDLLKPILAPRLYLIEYFRALVK